MLVFSLASHPSLSWHCLRSCCRCCCNKCRIKHIDEHTICKFVLVVCSIALLVACFGLLIAGLDMDARQSDAISGVGTTLETFTSWQPEFAAITETLSTAAATARTRAVALNVVDGANGDNLDDTAFTVLDAQLDGVKTASDSLAEQVSGISFGQFNDDLADQLETVDKSRSTAVRAVLATLLVVLLLQSLVGLLNAWNKCCVPKHIKLCYW